MKYVFIKNPIAGNKNLEAMMEKIQAGFKKGSDEMIIEETQYQGHATEIAKQYAEQYGDGCVMVSCGGDGTLHELSNGLAHTPTPLMVLPFGTGNDFAKKLYKSKKFDAQKIVENYGLYDGNLKYTVKPIDLIDYNGSKCINVMSYGLDTKVETLGRIIAGKVKFLGQKAYNLAVIPVVLQSMHYMINVDLNCIDDKGQEYKMVKTPMDYTLFAICNASYYGGGYCPAPNSLLDDGLLDFCYADPVNLFEVIPLVPKYSAGTADEHSDKIHVGYVTGGRIWSTDGSPLIGNCDGENFDYNEVNFSVEKHAMNLCFPEDDE